MLTPVRTGAPAVARSDRALALRGPATDLLVLAGLVVLAAALRFATLSHQSYWVDEATTVHEVGLSLGGLLHYVHVNESTPPLYFVVAWVWAKVFGTTEAGLRSLSALAGVALVPVAYASGRELVSRWTGVLAAALVALSPFMVWYSQEARSYALFALLAGLGFLFFVRTRRRGERRDIALWGLFSVLSVLTHFFAGFVVLPEAVMLLWWRRDRATVAVVAGVGLVHLAMLPVAISDTTHPLLRWITVLPLSQRLRELPVDLGLRTLYQSHIATAGPLAAALLAVAVAALLFFGGGPQRRRAAGIAAVVAGFAIAVPIVLALADHDYLVSRNLIAAWLALAVLIAAACTAPRTLPLGLALAALLLGAFLYAGLLIDARGEYQRPDWRGVAKALGQPRGQREIVAYDGAFASEPLAVYLPRVPWGATSATVSVDEVDVVGNAYQVPPATLPAGVRLISRASVPGFTVVRFAVPGWRLSVEAIARRSGSLLAPAPSAPAVLTQRAAR